MRLLLPTLQLGAVCLGCYVSISRISDNKHHVGDVVAGALIGAAGTLFTVCEPRQANLCLRAFRHDKL